MDDQEQDVRQDLDHMEGVDRCVICGEEIPEGRHVCPRCEAKARDGLPDRCVMCGAPIKTGYFCERCQKAIQEAVSDV